MDPAKTQIIDKDVFAYESTEPGICPMMQCISGFGRNFNDAIDSALDEEADGTREDHPAEVKSRLHWHTGELVRWCQHFNEKSQQQAARIVELERGHQADRARLVLLERQLNELRMAAEPWHAAGGPDNTDHNAHRRAAERLAEVIDSYEYAKDTPPRPVLDLATVDGDVVLSCAVRYAIGRQAYVVDSVIAAVRLTLPTMQAGRRKTLAKEIRKAEAEHRLGDGTIDAPAWRRLAEDLEKTNGEVSE